MRLPDRNSLVQRWERFWFTAIPPHSYAALRIAFGLIGLTGLAGLTPVSMFWWLDGIAPVPGANGVRSVIVNAGLGHLTGGIFYWALVASFAFMLIGFKTRWAVALCFVGSVIQSNWNRLPLSGAHKALMVVLFCLVWARCDGLWSIDSMRRRRVGDGHEEVDNGSVVIWPLRLIRFQVALIYLNSALWKLHSAVWRDGTATYYAMSSNVFQRFPFRFFGAGEVALTAATYLALAWELSFVLLLFNRRTRHFALLIGVAVHLAFWVALEVGLFSWVMLASYIAFLDPRDLADWSGRLRAQRAKRSAQVNRQRTTTNDRV